MGYYEQISFSITYILQRLLLSFIFTYGLLTNKNQKLNLQMVYQTVDYLDPRVKAVRGIYYTVIEADLT